MNKDILYKKMAKKILNHKYPEETFILKRFPQGIINYVFSAKSEKKDLVIRINGSFEYSEFEKEKWAFEQVKKQGVPVPSFVSLDISRKLIDKDYVIYRRVNGDTLSSKFSNFDFSKEDINKLLPTMSQVGYFMSKIHKIKMDSFGYLRKNVEGYHGVSHSLQDSLMPRAELFSLAEKGVIKKDFVNQILKELTWGIVKFKAEPVLLHLDLHGSNIIVDEGLNIKAIVDMENAMAGDPLIEFARLNRLYYKNPEIFEAIKEGYENKTIFSSGYMEKIRKYSIKYSSDLLPFYYKRKKIKEFKQIKGHVENLLKGKGI